MKRTLLRIAAWVRRVRPARRLIPYYDYDGRLIAYGPPNAFCDRAKRVVVWLHP